MASRCKIAYSLHFFLPHLLLFGLITGCTPLLSSLTPPENYKGPIAERPVTTAGDYWVYELADMRKVKGGTTLLANINFPLWVGKTWSYPGGALLMGQPRESKEFRIPTQIDCDVADFRQIAVTAGRFEAFECKCRCSVIDTGALYRPDCGEWTFWYAPQAKNIIKTKTESTAGTMELVAYDISGKVTKPAPIRRAPLQCLDPESRKKFPILCGS